MKKKNVLISLVSIESDGENKNRIELMTEGTLRYEDDFYEISYEESEMTGLEGTTTTVRVENGSTVMLDRTGTTTSDLVIELGKKHYCHYNTPYGSFTVGVQAKKVESDMNVNGGSLAAGYTLEINAEYAGDFEINIGVKPIKNTEGSSNG